MNKMAHHNDTDTTLLYIVMSRAVRIKEWIRIVSVGLPFHKDLWSWIAL